jgi:hypothetical protein
VLGSAYREEVQRVQAVQQLKRPTPSGLLVTGDQVADRAARRSLRDQVARLERELAAAGHFAVPAASVAPAHGGPRLLSLGELEVLRDALADRLRGLRAAAAEAAERQEGARLRVEGMLADPSAHKWVRVSNEDLGLPGCKHWHVRPRLGLIGMLAGWWHVRISSGCPLPGGSRPVPRPRTRRTSVGRRSRKARLEGRPAAAAATPARAPSPAEAPRAPWHPFPLVELCVLIGLVLIGVGLFSLSERRGGVLIVCGLALGSLAGLDTVLREHFAGLRSHTTLLAGVPAVVVAVVASFAGAPPAVVLAGAGVVFAGAFAGFRRAFGRASGGVGFR